MLEKNNETQNSFSTKISNMAAEAARSLSKNATKSTLPHTGIPIILRPFVIKKAYVVHPKTKSLQADLKAQWLTKSCLRKGLPELAFCWNNITSEQLDSLKQRTAKSLLHTIASQKIGLKWKMNYDTDLLHGLLPSLLIQFMNHVESRGRTLNGFKSPIRTHWCRNHDFYQTSFLPGYMFLSGTALPTFEPGYV